MKSGGWSRTSTLGRLLVKAISTGDGKAGAMTGGIWTQVIGGAADDSRRQDGRRIDFGAGSGGEAQ